MLLQSWAQSLRLLLPKNLKLFLLVTLKGISDVLIKYRYQRIERPSALTGMRVWWLLGILFIIGGPSVPLLVIAMSVCLFYVFLMARPSIRLKNVRYLCSYVMRYSTLVMIASAALFMAAKLHDAPLLHYLVYFVGPVAPLTVFTVLFMLDAKNTIPNLFGSMYRSALLVWYNAPIMILFYALWLVYIAFFGYVIDLGHVMHEKLTSVSLHDSLYMQLLSTIIFRLIAVMGWYIFTIVITPPLVLMTNYYVKRVHDNFTLYE